MCYVQCTVHVTQIANHHVLKSQAENSTIESIYGRYETLLVLTSEPRNWLLLFFVWITPVDWTMVKISQSKGVTVCICWNYLNTFTPSIQMEQAETQQSHKIIPK